MIQYSPLTLQQAVDEVMLRVSEHRTEVNLDWQTIVMFINRAIREVTIGMLPYKSWGFTSTIGVNNGQPLPINFIKPVRVLLSAGGAPPYREARRVSPRELHSLTNWYNKQSFNAASSLWPVYTIWGPRSATVNQTPVQSARFMYMGPYTNSIFGNQTGTAPTGYSYYTGSEMAGICDCYMSPRDLVNPTDLLPIPYEGEQIVILSAITRVFVKTGPADKLAYFQGLATKEQASLREQFAVRKRNEKIDFEALLDPMPVQQGGAAQ